jgi:hypothetical protein
MAFEVLPLLSLQRQLLEKPRDRARFQAYLKALLNAQGDGVELPLGQFNPMSREPIAALVDALQALGAEALLAAAAERVAGRFPALAPLKTGWVVGDDVAGAWTHRPTAELRRLRGKDYELEHGFCSLTWWASQGAPNASALQASALRQLYGLAIRATEGPQPSLGQLWDLQGRSRAFSGEAPLPDLPAGLSSATDDATLIAAVYGDAEALRLGYAPLGLLP